MVKYRDNECRCAGLSYFFPFEVRIDDSIHDSVAVDIASLVWLNKLSYCSSQTWDKENWIELKSLAYIFTKAP